MYSRLDNVIYGFYITYSTHNPMCSAFRARAASASSLNVHERRMPRSRRLGPLDRRAVLARVRVRVLVHLRRLRLLAHGFRALRVRDHDDVRVLALGVLGRLRLALLRRLAVERGRLRVRLRLGRALFLAPRRLLVGGRAGREAEERRLAPARLFPILLLLFRLALAIWPCVRMCMSDCEPGASDGRDSRFALSLSAASTLVKKLSLLCSDLFASALFANGLRPASALRANGFASAAHILVSTPPS